MTVLIIAEHNNSVLSPSTRSCVTAALQFGTELDLLIIGNDCDSVCETASMIQGVNRILCGMHKQLENPIAEDICQLIKNLPKAYEVILAPATTFGKNCLARLGAIFDVQPITDVIEIKSKDTFVRPIYAGNALATVQSLDKIKCLTVRPTAFNEAIFSDHKAPIEKISVNLNSANISVIKKEITPLERPELSSAKIIISGGRGLQGAEQFKLIENLADRLGAAVGASRAAVDAGFVPNDYQVGQTGKVVAPDLYIAIGISGAIQHIAGIKDSKVIVAINKDPDAPIFEIADYGLVADFFEILPALDAGLKKLGY